MKLFILIITRDIRSYVSSGTKILANNLSYFDTHILFYKYSECSFKPIHDHITAGNMAIMFCWLVY